MSSWEGTIRKGNPLDKGTTTSSISIRRCQIPGVFRRNGPELAPIRRTGVDDDIHKVLAERFQELGSLLGRFQRPGARETVIEDERLL